MGKGKIHQQINEAFRVATNGGRFGIKMRDILNEGYTKAENPYIRSFGTATKYKGIWHKFGRFLQKKFGINDFRQVRHEHVRAYVEKILSERHTARFLKQESSALGKLEIVLRKMGYNVDFSGRKRLNEVAREIGVRHEDRAYKNPLLIISRMRRIEHVIAGRLMLEGGMRIHEANWIRAKDLLGVRFDKISGDFRGVIRVEGKGGKEREVYVSEGLYRVLERYVERYGRFKFDKEKFYRDLRRACREVGEKYKGAHGFRYNFARQRLDEALRYFESESSAWRRVSEELGHNRVEITGYYLLR